MTGTYKTIDGNIYQVYFDKVGKPAKTQMVAVCLKSTVRAGPFTPFPLLEGQIEKNIRHNYWTRIES